MFENYPKCIVPQVLKKNGLTSRKVAILGEMKENVILVVTHPHTTLFGMEFSIIFSYQLRFSATYVL